MVDTKAGRDFYDSLSDHQKELVDNVMLATMSMCSEWTEDPLFFPEDMAYKIFRSEMLTHMCNDEYYDNDKKQWIKLSK